MIKQIGTLLLVTALTLGTALAQDTDEKTDKKDKKEKVTVEKVVLKPDLRPAAILTPAGIVLGPGNQVKVLVENLSKDSKFENKVKVELVVIQDKSSDRMSYFAELDPIPFGKKQELVFTVEVKNDNFVRLLAIVDSEKVVEEENEDNNRRIYQVSIKKAEPTPTPSASPAEASPAE